ncbi:MAG: hypothetical protein MJZ15_01910 [Bacteroidales bacterium]|nr:hypothetical protein [Bacteroidales bacterium]
MMRFLIYFNVLLVVALSFSSCEKDEEVIHFDKHIYVNQCDSDITLRALGLSYDSSSNCYIDSTDININKGGIASQVTAHGKPWTMNNEFIPFSYSFRILAGDSIVSCVTRDYDNRVTEGVGLTYILVESGWCDSDLYDYSVSADTAIYSYTITNEKIQSLSNYFINHFGIHPQIIQ